ncbi:MAG: alpha/beta hydrolase [Bacteroidota bacterium]
MKLFLKILKWIGLSISSVLVIIILSGIAFRLFKAKSYEPKGELVDVGGFKLHINSYGEKHPIKPTLVIEGGSGTPEEYYHWLSEGLKDSMRVVRYDRAGIGYSDACRTPRDPETISHELHELLEKSGENPPYILAGHSIGGSFIRVYTQLYPDEVEALVFMDCTHPDRVEKLDLPKQNSPTMKLMVNSYYALGVLADMGILGLYESIWGRILPGEGLPQDVNDRITAFTHEGMLARTAAMEMAHYHTNLKRAAETTDFGSRPIRVFVGGQPMSEAGKEFYRKKGMDPDEAGQINLDLHKDFANLSSDGEVFILNGTHTSIYTKKENADVICREILELLDASPDSSLVEVPIAGN